LLTFSFQKIADDVGAVIALLEDEPAGDEASSPLVVFRTACGHRNVSQRHVADFIEQDQVIAQPTRQHTFHSILLPCFDQLVDQVRGRGESRSPIVSPSFYKPITEA
jgi:hypothetical protein